MLTRTDRPWTDIVSSTVVLLLMASGVAVAGQQPEAFVRSSSPPERSAASPTVVRERLVEVASSSRLSDPNESREMGLDLFPDLHLRATRTHWSMIPGGATWTGELDGYPGSRAVFATVDGEVVGHISAPFGYFTLRRGTDGAYVVQQIDPSAAGPRLDDSVAAGDADSPADARNADGRVGPRLDAGGTIDVMAVITRDAVVGFGSEATARATVQVALAETNEALRASGVPTTLRLVHVEIVDHPESKDSGLELRRLQNPSDGVLDQVHAWRDAHAADLVILVLESFTQNLGGQAYVNALTSTGTWGFSVVRRRAIDEERILAHEIGHNLGAAHDWYVTSAPGAFSYAKGHTDLQGRLLDIMSYWDLCRDTHTDCSQLLVYSNPRVRHQGVMMGVPVGTSTACRERVPPDVACDADSASVLARMAPTVARFRNSRLSLSSRRLRPGESSRSANGRYRLTYQTDGDLVLVDTADGRQIWATETGGTTPGEAAMQPDGDFTVTDATGSARWSANTGRNPNAYFVVQDDGTFVILRADGQPLWGSRTWAG